MRPFRPTDVRPGEDPGTAQVSGAPEGPEAAEGSGTSRRGLLTGAVAAAAAGGGGLLGAGSASAAPAGRRHRGRGWTPAPVGFVPSHEQYRTSRLVHWAEEAEQAGFGHVWASDHFQPWQDNQQHSMYPWNTLSLVAEETSRIELGTGVTCPTYRHHPSQVAQAFASLGILAPGRVFLGVGTGEAVNELAATGRFGPYRERAARWVEAITLIRRLWTGERVTFEGDYYRTVEAKLYDVPREPVPIYMAASGPHSAYLAGRYGDGWIGGSGDITNPELRRAFERGAREAGKDPDAMPKYAETFVVVGDERAARQAARLWHFTVDPWDPALLYEPNPVEIQRKAEAMWPLEQVYSGWAVGTDPQVHVEAVQQVLDAGATPFIHSGQPDLDPVIDFYERHVLPEVRRP